MTAAEELLVALAALDEVIQRVTGPIYDLGEDRFPAVDASSVTALATLPGASPKEAESMIWDHQPANDHVIACAIILECDINLAYTDSPFLNKKNKLFW